ncbi:MAG: hypothetical protein NC218_07630 [Acetobacter sp.]|nr:hypothetical protein [Acetobacter sp.]
MQNIIITPTYVGHFQFIPAYLKSFKKYARGNNYLISFLISKSEEKKFLKILERFPSLPIDVLYFEDILQEFAISEAPEMLLRKYGKFSYQTLKKFYAMLHYGKNARFLVLDSESMLIRQTNINQLFDNFFTTPFISYTHLNKRLSVSTFVQRVVDNNTFLGLDNGIWCLENFVWYYDYKILSDMFKHLGTPFEIIEKVHMHNVSNSLLAGVFEIELYQNWIYQNAKKYGYMCIDVDNEIEQNIPQHELDNYKTLFFNTYNGNCGMLERSMIFLHSENVNYFASLFKKNNFNIIRCNDSNIKNYAFQKQFIDIVQPNILAASQNHCFGINNTFKKRCTVLLGNNKYMIKLRKHWGYFIDPIKKYILNPVCNFVTWLTQPFALVIYIIKLFIELLKNLHLILLG